MCEGIGGCTDMRSPLAVIVTTRPLERREMGEAAAKTTVLLDDG
jgi:hypothetical protein